MKHVSLADQYNTVIRTTGSVNDDWDNARIENELKRMIIEEPNIPAWVTNEIARYPNNWSMDI